MASNPRPTKRLRRSTSALSSDSQDVAVVRLPTRQSAVVKNTIGISASRTGTAHKAKGKKAAQSTSARSSPKSSPEKARKFQKLNVDTSKNKSLHTFFGRVTEQERWHRASPTADESNPPGSLHEDDIIDDDSMDEALNEAIRSSKQGSFSGDSKPSASQSKAPSLSSQRFRKPAIPPSHNVPTTVKQADSPPDVRPWAERYSPSSLEELAVHKKKVQDVQRWVDDALAGRVRQRILVLKGPAGSGKSTTLQLVAQARRTNIVAWQNPDTSETAAGSSSVQFTEFVTRGGDYNALSLSSSTSPLASQTDQCLLLIEEFPATLTKSSNALESFRSVLLRTATMIDSSSFIGKGVDSHMHPPIVLIVSETLVSTSTSFSDSFTAQRLLGPELINHFGVCVIEFNPIAPTILAKALELVTKKEARDSGRRRIPGHAVFQKLTELGDVRNAINSLQFLCTRSDDTSDWSGTVATSTKRSSKSNPPLSQMEEDSLKLMSARESTLDMFHAAGKICYNKREDPRVHDRRAEPPPKPPDHLACFARPKVSLVDIEELLNETGTDIQTFVSTVHQNYVLSCNHHDFVEYLDGCASSLSDCELLDPHGRSTTRSRARAYGSKSTFQLGTSDSLRQDEISFQVATRGVLFNLPFPVNRSTPPGGVKGTAFKMYYPASLRLWRPIEEMEGLLDVATTRYLGQTPNSTASNENDSVASWKGRASAFASRTGQVHNANDADDVAARSDFSRDSLVLEVLPYLTKIRQARGEDTIVLRKITQLHGFNIVVEDEPDGDDAAVEPRRPTFSEKIDAVHARLQTTKDVVEEASIERLWIEDDDIEDD